MYLVYSVLYGLALLLVLPFQLRKRPKGLRRRWLRERLGGPFEGEAPEGERPIWVHAVSVGEVMAAAPLLKTLKERHPRLRLVVSTVTDTGQQVASERLAGLAQVIYLPLDLGFILKRAAARLRPRLFVVMETELWPNAFRTMKALHVPVLVVNGRISNESFRGYRRIRFFLKRVLRDVDLFCMQDERYARRVRELGAMENKTVVTGNFKFDFKVVHEVPGWARGLSGPVIVAGSTHRGEEELVLSAFARLREDFGGLRLVLAPRHPERCDEVEALLKARGIPYRRRSQLPSATPSQPESLINEPVVLLDTVGELARTYGAADIAVVGGSFIAHGGQNPLEPAAWGKPVVCGPHMENFPFVEEFYRAGAMLSVQGQELFGALGELLRQPEKRQAMGARAQEVLKRNRGSVDKAVRAIEERLTP